MLFHAASAGKKKAKQKLNIINSFRPVLDSKASKIKTGQLLK